MRKIIFYKLTNGKSPIKDFLDSLNPKEAQKVLWVLKLVQELDRVPSEYLKKLVNTDDIWEVRISQGGNIFRLLGFFYDGNWVVLTNAFQKKTQKTPDHEISLAEERKKLYQNSNKRMS